MLELLVASLCIGDFGCDKAFKAYYYERPRLKHLSREVRNKVVTQVGESVAYTVPALLAAASGRDYQVKLGRKWSIGRSDNYNMVLYRLDF